MEYRYGKLENFSLIPNNNDSIMISSKYHGENLLSDFLSCFYSLFVSSALLSVIKVVFNSKISPKIL